MRRIRFVLLGALLLAGSAGMLFVGTAPSYAQRGPEHREDQSYWRHHEGRWSHWDARDRRWYYTDGSHWFWHNGKAWEPYRFDKTFGRDNFFRGNYVPPREGVPVVVPTHPVYVPR
jgi:hypothetical protein